MAVTPAGATELAWQVDGLKIAGLAWGEEGAPPLLALHGWLDNAASFAVLAPHLPGHRLVALDLTGHGQSDRRSDDATYQIYDDLPQIHQVLEQLGWQQFDLLGHSRGAIISALFAAAFPERVGRLVLLDGVAPPPLDEGQFAGQLRRYVLEKRRLLNRRSRVYPSVGEAVSAREEQGLSHAAAVLIAGRNLRHCEGGHTWTTDPRLRGASAMKMTAGQVRAMLGALDMPTLLLAAEQGLAVTRGDKFQSLGDHIPGCAVESFPGGHHFHMEAGVAKLGERICKFLNRG